MGRAAEDLVIAALPLALAALFAGAPEVAGSVGVARPPEGAGSPGVTVPPGIAAPQGLAAPRDVAARLAEAERLLAEGEAAAAARAYEALAVEGVESAALHVNLGLARWRAGRAGAAVASWERALRLDPRDADARANLAAVRAAEADRLAPAPERTFLDRVAERTPDGWAAAAFAVPWAALFAALAARRRAGPRLRAALGAAAALAAVLSAGGSAVLAARAGERRAEVAVVVSPDAPLRDGPEEALRPSLRLREGTVVRVVERRAEALRVRVAGGVEGWVTARDVEEI